MQNNEKTPLLMGFVNFFILQWFFVRLAIKVDPALDGYITVRRQLLLMWFVFPLTGWFGIKYFPKSHNFTLLIPGIDAVDPKCCSERYRSLSKDY